MEEAGTDTSPRGSPTESFRSEDLGEVRPKKTRKKRRSDMESLDGKEGKTKKKRNKEEKLMKERKKEKRAKNAAQQATQDKMRRALEDDRYSAVGSIVSDTDSGDDDEQIHKSDVRAAMKRMLWTMERRRDGAASAADKTDSEGEAESARSTGSRRGRKKKPKRKPGKPTKVIDESSKSSGLAIAIASRHPASDRPPKPTSGPGPGPGPDAGKGDDPYEEGSIFGPTTGSTQTTWVECDKCKKVRTLFCELN